MSTEWLNQYSKDILDYALGQRERWKFPIIVPREVMRADGKDRARGVAKAFADSVKTMTDKARELEAIVVNPQPTPFFDSSIIKGNDGSFIATIAVDLIVPRKEST